MSRLDAANRTVDRAITAEVRALLADRGWTFKQAAAAFGLSASRVNNLLSGQTRWLVADVFAVAAVTGSDEDDEISRLFSIGRNALHSSA